LTLIIDFRATIWKSNESPIPKEFSAAIELQALMNSPKSVEMLAPLKPKGDLGHEESRDSSGLDVDDGVLSDR
jgi:hypothetical protein